MSGNELTFTLNNPYPSPTGSVLTPTGGSWTAGSISWKVLAVMADGTITDVDFFGVNRDTTSAWNNVAVASNDKVVFSFDIPNNEIPYDYYFIYQIASSFNTANAATKCTMTLSQTDYNTYQATISDDDNLGSITLGDSPSASANPILQLTPRVKELTIRSYKGYPVAKSFAYDTLNDEIDILLSMFTSITPADNKKLLKWLKYSLPIKISESLTGSDVFISNYYGKLTNTDYIHSKNKNQNDSISYTFKVYDEDYA